MKRQQYLEQKMLEENIDGLDIYWYLQMGKTHNDLPGYVEGLLIQKYFDIHAKLPPGNK